MVWVGSTERKAKSLEGPGDVWMAEGGGRTGGAKGYVEI